MIPDQLVAPAFLVGLIAFGLFVGWVANGLSNILNSIHEKHVHAHEIAVVATDVTVEAPAAAIVRDEAVRLGAAEF